MTLSCLRDKLFQEVNARGIGEVKFVKITRYNSPKTQAARAFIKAAISYFAIYKKIRIDTITRDNQPYGKKPDLEHMYYCLLSHIVRQWQNTKWDFYPDVNSKINWSDIISFLNLARLQKKVKNPLLVELLLRENPLFQFSKIEQLCSIKEPLIQLADLFAGLARFSNEQNVDCSEWIVNQENGWQSKMNMGVNKESNPIPQTNRCRYQIISELYSLCSKHRLYVSIKTKKHLWTRKHNSPVNFWDYDKRWISTNKKP